VCRVLLVHKVAELEGSLDDGGSTGSLALLGVLVVDKLQKVTHVEDDRVTAAGSVTQKQNNPISYR